MHLTAHLDIDLLALAADEELTCLVELTAPTPPEGAERPGQAVVVVLDRSGSMSGGRPGGGSPIEAARAAIVDLMRRLSPRTCSASSRSTASSTSSSPSAAWRTGSSMR